MKSLKSFSRLLFNFVIVFQFALGFTILQHPVRAVAQESGDDGKAPSNPDDKLFEMAKADPRIREVTENHQKYFETLRDGDIDRMKLADADGLHLSRQSISYNVAGELQNVDIFKNSSQLKSIGYTGIDLDIREGDVVLSAKNGNEVMATHRFHGLDPVSVTKDAEMVVIVSRNGQVHVISMISAAQYVFQEPVPLFKDLFRVPEIHATEKLNIKFMTRAESLPVSLNDLILEDSDRDRNRVTGDVVPRRIYSSGDLLISRVNQSGEVVPVGKGVYPRSLIYDFDKLYRQYFAAMAMVAVPEKMDINLVEEYAKKIVEEDPRELRKFLEGSKTIERGLPGSTQNQSDPVHRMLLSKLSPEHINDLVQKMEEVEGLKKRSFDRDTLDVWNKDTQRLIVEAQREVTEYEANKGKFFAGVSTDIGDRDEYKGMQEALERRRLGAYSDDLMQRMYGEHNKLTRAQKIWKTLLSKKVTISLAGIFGGYYAVDYAIEQQLKIIDTIEKNFVPPVLKEFYVDGVMYRESLLKSMAVITAIIPLSMLLSAVTVPSLRLMSKIMRGKNDVLADRLEQKANKLSKLGLWQKIMTFGTRVYSKFTLIFIHYMWFAQGQLNKAAAIINEVDVNRIVRDKSGKVILDRDGKTPLRVGKNIRTLEPVKNYVREKLAMSPREYQYMEIEKSQQSEMSRAVREADLAKTLSFFLATKSLSTDKTIDMATLKLLMQEGLQPGDLNRIKNDKALNLKWQLMQAQLSKQLLELMSKTPEYLQRLTQKNEGDVLFRALQIRQNLDKMDLPKLKFESYKNRASLFTKSLSKKMLNFGRADSDFTSKVVTNKFVTRQEMYAFLPDHLSLATYPHLFGARANPDDKAALI
ncbi:MAG: hypothetical protein AB8E15_14005, partial [Bdellovibrionales bacterium]